ncbi:MAG TPA: DUF2800 domain-containing protein [Hyphomicrobiaceae bacterium]|nr:DUF2800 domain-containing protein [Hyphomicrobiaceae bacterium]
MSHSTLVGGSTASRLIACPGSFAAILALPPSTDIPSPYAEEGTFAHAVMEQLMLHRQANPRDCTQAKLVRVVRKWTGQVFYDRKLTDEHIDELIAPALAGLHDLEAEYGGGFNVAAVEAQVRFPKLFNAFGTADLILTSKDKVLLVDWKFGAGVPVHASWTDADDYLAINPQLLFYLTAAKATLPKLFKGRRMVAAIVQPRSEHILSHTEVLPSDIIIFKQDLMEAVDKAIAPAAPRRKGEHCRFAACKMTCPLWTGPLLDLSLIQPETPAAATGGPTAYGKYLAHAKTLVDMAALYKREIDEQMHAYLEAGGLIPGWRLKAKTKQRQWIEEEIVADVLIRLGFRPADIWQQKLVTFAAADAAAKRLGVKIPDELRVAPETNETTIATVDDPAPVVDRGLAIEQFRASLGHLLLQGESK